MYKPIIVEVEKNLFSTTAIFKRGQASISINVTFFTRSFIISDSVRVLLITVQLFYNLRNNMLKIIYVSQHLILICERFVSGNLLRKLYVDSIKLLLFLIVTSHFYVIMQNKSENSPEVFPASFLSFPFPFSFPFPK